MKFIKAFLTAIISFTLAIFIFILSVSFAAKSVIQSDVILPVLKESFVTEYSKNKDKLTEEQRKAIDDVLNSNKADELVKLFVDNITEYASDQKGYSISDKDVEKVKNFIKENKDLINSFSDEEVTDEFIDKEVTKSNLTNLLNEATNDLDLEDANVKTVFVTYNNFTSRDFRLSIVIIMIALIALLMLINASVFKFMVPSGVSLIISGSLLGIIYIAFDTIKRVIMSGSNVPEYLEAIKFKSLLTMTIVEIVLGIILCVVYGIIKKKVLAPKEDNRLNISEEEIKQNNKKKFILLFVGHILALGVLGFGLFSFVKSIAGDLLFDEKASYGTITVESENYSYVASLDKNKKVTSLKRNGTVIKDVNGYSSDRLANYIAYDLKANSEVNDNSIILINKSKSLKDSLVELSLQESMKEMTSKFKKFAIIFVEISSEAEDLAKENNISPLYASLIIKLNLANSSLATSSLAKSDYSDIVTVFFNNKDKVTEANYTILYSVEGDYTFDYLEDVPVYRKNGSSSSEINNTVVKNNNSGNTKSAANNDSYSNNSSNQEKAYSDPIPMDFDCPSGYEPIYSIDKCTRIIPGISTEAECKSFKTNGETTWNQIWGTNDYECSEYIDPVK